MPARRFDRCHHDIESVDAAPIFNADNIEYFDIQGRKVPQPTKGIYIVNGKKMLVR